MCNDEFIHAHLHSRASFKDGLSSIDELVEKAAGLGQPGIALTDHGVLFGAPDLFKACDKHGIKGVVGMEIYEAEPHEFLMERDGEIFKITWAQLQETGQNRYYHLTLWALNEAGWKNLCALHSLSWSPDYYPTQRGKPLVDRKTLAAHSEGIMVGLGCIASKTNQALIKNQSDEPAYEVARWYVDTFPGRVVMEIMGNLPEQQSLIHRQVKLARRLGVPVIVSNDVHYRDEEDGAEHGAHHALVKSRAFKKSGETEKSDDRSDAGFGAWYGNGFWLKSGEEMAEMAGVQTEYMTNTTRVLLDAVSFDFSQLPTPKAPIAPVPVEGEDSAFDKWLEIQS